MAIINGNKYISGGGSDYFKDVFDSTNLSVTKGQWSDTGTKINVTGKGLVTILGFINRDTATLTMTIDGKTITGTIGDLADIFGSRVHAGTNYQSALTVKFEESAVVTLTSASSSITTYLTM